MKEKLVTHAGKFENLSLKNFGEQSECFLWQFIENIFEQNIRLFDSDNDLWFG